MKKETLGINETNDLSIYLDYVNNFLTVECCAEYYNVSVASMENSIKCGRDINDSLAATKSIFNK